MQEDKTSKWLASQLRKHQEEDPLPYELGAWEAFESKRAGKSNKKPSYWLSGIAAALVLVTIAGGLWISRDVTELPSDPAINAIALEEVPLAGSEESTTASTDGTPVDSSPRSTQPSVGESSPSTRRTAPSLAFGKNGQTDKTSSSGDAKVNNPGISQPTIRPLPNILEPANSQNLAIMSEPVKEPGTKTVELGDLLAIDEQQVEQRVQVAEKPKETVAGLFPKEPQLSEEEIKDLLETKSFARLAMGVSPGFGASQNSRQATSGTSLGLGVMVDMEITGKLVMGSGLAVNYLNQTSEGQSYNPGAALSNAVTMTETSKINQVQVDIPLYFKYPVTRDNGVSVQAGFSNLITFNQGAQQESSYTRQIAVLDAGSASFKMMSEAVNQSQDLAVPNQKFYPLATANLGVNIRVFESQKASYEVMPFYNHPLQEFSGYGEKLGMFGASFKVNFGTIHKK